MAGQRHGTVTNTWDAVRMIYKRLALYYAPRPSYLSRAMAGWLGWDPIEGCEVGPVPGTPDVDADITQAARKYGFHGTLKAPFRLRDGVGLDDVTTEVGKIAALLKPIEATGLRLTQIGGFLALVPEGAGSAISALAADVVRRLDPFRAPLTQPEIARRNPGRLTDRQRDYLETWGYPYVLEEFKFHLTLTGDLMPDQAEGLAQRLEPWLLPILPRPFVIKDICLFGEAADARFHLLSRHALTG